MKNRLLLIASGLIALVGNSKAQTTVNAPINVPLHFTELSPGIYKLGIYAGIGTGGAPQLFEFDTGGVGFYAAYSSDSSVAPWWGANTVPDPNTQIVCQYDSGLTYTGVVAQAAVSLYESKTSTTALITTASTAQVGQMNLIQQENPSTGAVVSTLWDNSGSSEPPIDKKFYGDFGMNLMYNTIPNSSGISNLIGQLQYGAGVTAGFRIHADLVNKEAWLQIGLTAADTDSATTKFFKMNLDGAAPSGAHMPVSNLAYYSQQLFNATISIQNPGDTPLVSENVGITPDTGASTTLHNTQLSPEASEYENYIAWSDAQQNLGDLENGLNFGLSGTTVDGETVDYFNFPTTGVPDAGNVMVQNNRPDNQTYYLNTGISLFYQYDVVYNMAEGQLGLDPIPEPSVTAMFVLGLGGVLLLGGRRAIQGGKARKSATL